MPSEAGVLDDWVQSVGRGARSGGGRPRLNSEFAPLFTRAVYESVLDMEVRPLHLGIVYELNAAYATKLASFCQLLASCTSS